MINPQQSSGINLASFFQSLNPAINPNLNLYFPQPVIPSELPFSGPVLNPPTTDPYGSPGSNLSNYGGFEGQPPIYDDPNAGSQSWVVQQAEPNTHAVPIHSLNERSMAATDVYTPGNNVLTNQPLVNNVTKSVPRKTKVILSMRCEVCDIDCNSKDVYERHISGKKHNKKSEMHNNPATTASGASSAVAGENLETKRQKLVEGGATVAFMRVCTMCNALCNSQEMFDIHLAGKKHAAQARKHSQDGMEQSVAANPNYTSGIGPTFLPQGTGPCESDPNKTSVDQFACCEVCNIYCNSNNVLGVHKLGKKHLKNLGKLRKMETDISTPAPTDALGTAVLVTGPMEEVNQDGTDELKNENAAESPAPREDSETKKRKIMAVGADGMVPSAAANPDSVSGISPMVLPQDNKNGGDPNKISGNKFAWCEVCNIYCMSEDVLNVHKSGKKHLKNLEKLRKMETDTSTPAPTDAPGMTVLVTGPMEEFSQGGTDELKNENAAESHAPREDSETKKRKIMEVGADGMVPSVAANPDSVSGISPTVLPQDNKNGGDSNKISANKFARCEVCNIYCTSEDGLIVHKSGKKHLKNMEKLKTETDINIRASTDPPVTTVPVLQSMKNPEASQGEIDELNNENGESREDSGTKKRKITGGVADGNGIEQSVAANPDSICGIGTTLFPQVNKTGRCEIDPNNISADQFAFANPDSVPRSSPTVLPQENRNGACESTPNKISADQFQRCEVCNIYCTSNDGLFVHKLGKKHLKNLEKLKKMETDTSSSASKNALTLSIPVNGPMDNPETSQGKSNDSKNKNAAESLALKEDLETKKRKIMEVGAAGDAVRVCTICNVVCNSQTVLDSHLAGKKHATMARKLAAIRFIATAGSQFVEAT